MHPPTLRTPTEGRTIAVVGDVYRFLATSLLKKQSQNMLGLKAIFSFLWMSRFPMT